LSKQIQGIIEKNPELQTMINDLRKSKIKLSWDAARKEDKVISSRGFPETQIKVTSAED